MRSSIVATAIGLSVLSGAHPALAKPDAPSAPLGEREARERSRAHFRSGVAQLRAEDWKGARASFEQAWTLFPHPSILLNLGVARLRTDEPVLAEQALVRFLSEDFGASPEELAGARAALAEARSSIGTLRVAVSPPGATVMVDGRPIAEREVRLAAGKHTVAANADGYAPQEQTVDLAARSEVETRIDLTTLASTNDDLGTNREAPSVGASPRTVTGYALGGLAGVALVTAGICGFRAISLASDYEERAQPETFQNPDVKSEGETFRTLADVALGVAVVSGVAAAMLLLTDIGASRRADVRRSPGVLRW